MSLFCILIGIANIIMSLVFSMANEYSRATYHLVMGIWVVNTGIENKH